MNHGISPPEWERYLDGKLTAPEHDHIEAHLISCMPCWELQQRLATLNRQLHEAGETISNSFPLSDEKLQVALHNVYARIHAQHENAPPNPVRQRLGELEAVMTVFCGEQTAVKALQAAAAHSPAKSLKRVTRENWEPFLQRLGMIAHVLCGRTGAHWLLESGRL